jgi:hypothetical protein
LGVEPFGWGILRGGKISSLLPITKTHPNRKIGLVSHFRFFFLLGPIGFLIVVIENQLVNRLVKQWVQPPINTNRLPPGGSLLGSHLTCVF